MHIRKATLNDAGGIAQVSVHSWKTTYKGIVSKDFLENMSVKDRTERWEEKINKNDQFIYVAEDKDYGIVGYGSGGKARNTHTLEQPGELYALYIRKDFQGKRIGSRLFMEIVEALLQYQYKEMIVWVLEANPYINFYRVLGGEMAEKDTLELAGRTYRLLGYTWKNITSLHTLLRARC